MLVEPPIPADTTTDPLAALFGGASFPEEVFLLNAEPGTDYGHLGLRVNGERGVAVFASEDDALFGWAIAFPEFEEATPEPMSFDRAREVAKSYIGQTSGEPAVALFLLDAQGEHVATHYVR